MYTAEPAAAHLLQIGPDQPFMADQALPSSMGSRKKFQIFSTKACALACLAALLHPVFRAGDLIPCCLAPFPLLFSCLYASF